MVMAICYPRLQLLNCKFLTVNALDRRGAKRKNSDQHVVSCDAAML